MNCIVTAGPAYEPLDQVRRLTNFSTGRLGTELAEFLSSAGHRTTLVRSGQAVWGVERHNLTSVTFETGTDLAERLQGLAGEAVDAVFHAAAVGDFKFGKVWAREEDGSLAEVRRAKLPTRRGVLLAELVPTPKIIGELRRWFPQALLVGWKYEVDGQRAAVLRAGVAQIESYGTNACVVNGPAYGSGYGLVRGPNQTTHLEERVALYEALEKLLDGSGG